MLLNRRRTKNIDPTRTIGLRRKIAMEMRRRFRLLRGRLLKLVVDDDSFGLKEPRQFKPITVHSRSSLIVYNEEGGPGWTEYPNLDTMPLIEVPDIRQHDHYSCGAASTMAVGRYFGAGEDSLTWWKKELGTDVEESTHPQAIVELLSRLGLDVVARSGMSLQELQDAYRAGRPVICPVQDYGPYVPEKARFSYGHYLTVIGIDKGYVFCQDSSADNVRAGSGTVEKPGRIMVDQRTWMDIWHDVDVDGNPYVRFGIIVGPGTAGIRHPITNLDAGGGEEPEVAGSALKTADFITLPKGVQGTNCSNCKFQKEGVCRHPKLDGQPVNERNCCGYWDSAGTLREWGRAPTANVRWAALPDAEKVEAFQEWLRAQLKELITSDDVEELWEEYARQGFLKGAARSFDDVKKPFRAGDFSEAGASFYRGTKEQFLQSAFGRPVAVEKVKLLAGRSFDDLEGVAADAVLKLSRSLTDGLVRGQNPREIAKDMDDDLELGESRAETIARTEIVRAHAEGQLEAMEQLGVEEVGVEVEWTTADDDRVCPACEPLEGVVLPIEDARGMLPRHPNCRCAWVPANVGEADEGQKRGKAADRAVEESDAALNAATDPLEALSSALARTSAP